MRWATVRKGLLVLQFAALLGMPGILLAACFLFPDRTSAAVVGESRSLWLAGAGLILLVGVGHFLCCSAPDPARAPRLAGASFVALLLATVTAIVIAAGGGLGLAVGDLLWVAGMVFGALGHILFVFFLRAAATFFDRGAVSHALGVYLVLYVICALVGLVCIEISLLPAVEPQGREAQIAAQPRRPQPADGIGPIINASDVWVDLTYLRVTLPVAVMLILSLVFFCLLNRTRTAIAEGVLWRYPDPEA
jgi:hypothetical protein